MDTQVCAAYLPFSCSPPPPRDRIIVVLLHLGSACVHADDAYAPLEPTKLMYRVTQRPQVSLFNCSQVNYANLKNPQKIFNFMLTNSQESRNWRWWSFCLKLLEDHWQTPPCFSKSYPIPLSKCGVWCDRLGRAKSDWFSCISGDKSNQWPCLIRLLLKFLNICTQTFAPNWAFSAQWFWVDFWWMCNSMWGYK